MSAGDEWLLPVQADLTALRECVEAICDAWPEAVVEDTAAGEFAYSVDALVPTEESELCVYRDLEVTRRWQQGGPPRQMHNLMVQVSLSPHGVRLLADDWRNATMSEVVRHLKSWQAECRIASPK